MNHRLTTKSYLRLHATAVARGSWRFLLTSPWPESI